MTHCCHVIVPFNRYSATKILVVNVLGYLSEITDGFSNLSSDEPGHQESESEASNANPDHDKDGVLDRI